MIHFKKVKGMPDMSGDKAIVIANSTSEGVSLIDLQIYNEKGVLCRQPSKDFIDDINHIPYLDREGIRNVISQEFGIPADHIVFQ
jgi:hypothetical protein